VGAYLNSPLSSVYQTEMSLNYSLVRSWKFTLLGSVRLPKRISL
jgi:hypothetical protein